MNQIYGALRVIRMSSFAEQHLARWQDVPRLSHRPRVYVLTRHETTIGRELINDIQLTDPLVSREHVSTDLSLQVVSGSRFSLWICSRWGKPRCNWLPLHR